MQKANAQGEEACAKQSRADEADIDQSVRLVAAGDRIEKKNPTGSRIAVDGTEDPTNAFHPFDNRASST